MRAVILALLVVAGCGTTSNKPKPSWVRGGPNLDHPDYHLVVGFCRDKASADAARQCAEAAARRQIYDVFQVRGGLIRDEYSERRTDMVERGNGEWVPKKFWSTWILMAYPRKK